MSGREKGGHCPSEGPADPQVRRRVSRCLVIVHGGLHVCSPPARDSCPVFGPYALLGSPASSHTKPQPALRAEPSQGAKLPLQRLHLDSFLRLCLKLGHYPTLSSKGHWEISRKLASVNFPVLLLSWPSELSRGAGCFYRLSPAEPSRSVGGGAEETHRVADPFSQNCHKNICILSPTLSTRDWHSSRSKVGSTFLPLKPEWGW